MFKYFIGLGILLLCLIIVTLWYSQQRTDPIAEAPEEYVVLPVTEVEPLPVPKNFDELLVTPPTNLFQNVLDQTYVDTFIVVSCRSSQDTEKAVLLTAKYNETPTGNNFDAAKQAVSAWELLLLQDMGKIIFPSISESEVSQPVKFTNVPETDYRIAPVTIGGKKTSVHYGWQDNYVVFASTKECLGEILRTVQDGA